MECGNLLGALRAQLDAPKCRREHVPSVRGHLHRGVAIAAQLRKPGPDTVEVCGKVAAPLLEGVESDSHKEVLSYPNSSSASRHTPNIGSPGSEPRTQT